MNPMNPSPPAVEIKNLHYSYDGAEAIQGVNLTVAAGSCHALFGRNGAGKTTTMKCLLNLLRPQAGSVRIFGLDPATQEIEVKRRIAYVPDSPAFYPWMTVRETLDYLASFREGWNGAKEKDPRAFRATRGSDSLARWGAESDSGSRAGVDREWES